MVQGVGEMKDKRRKEIAEAIEVMIAAAIAGSMLLAYLYFMGYA